MAFTGKLVFDFTGTVSHSEGSLEGERGAEVSHAVLSLLKDTTGLLTANHAAHDSLKKLSVTTKGTTFQATIQSNKITVVQI